MLNYSNFVLTGFKNSKWFCSEELKNLFRYPFAEEVGAEVLVILNKVRKVCNVFIADCYGDDLD